MALRTAAGSGTTTQPDDHAATVYVGRQPIVDNRSRLVGYELLYRDGMTATARIDDPDRATYRVATRLVLDIGWEALVGAHFATINASRGFLADEGYRILPADRTVVEILENVEVDDALFAQAQLARDLGYRLALDDYCGASDQDRLAPLASIVKIDVLAVAPADLPAVVAHVRRLAPGARLLAEKVETAEDIATCARLGCDLFQGYFVGRPEIRAGRQVPAGSISAVRLLAELQDPEASVAQLAATLERDPVLAHRMLVLVNSAGWGLAHPVTSLRHALVMLGVDHARRLAGVLALSVLSGHAGHVAEHLVVRAKTCEQVAARLGRPDPGEAFIVGLFSGLDVLLGLPMAAVLGGLPLTDAVRAALMAQEGPLGALLGAAVHFEAGRVEDLPGGLACWIASSRDALVWAGALRPELVH